LTYKCIVVVVTVTTSNEGCKSHGEEIIMGIDKPIPTTEILLGISAIKHTGKV